MVVERFSRAYALLSKTLQLIAGLGLNERESRYLLTNPTDFPELDLSKLPTREADDSLPGAQALFGQFTRLADYARLKQELAGGGDDLIGVFENARRGRREIASVEQAKTAHFEPFARLTRREEATVRAASESLGFAITTAADGNGQRVETPDLANEKGLTRLWEALKAVETLGVPTGAVVRWTEIISPAKNHDERFAIARDLKNTVKARFEQESWRRIAQSIFDKLRQRQRDALVAYIMHRLSFERVEQLFEYFLIDPGMEPVAQTSRLRLAISSVQLFIQRCLLNLEPRVQPSAINAAHWQWMKRYRVWEANRKIFLFPENWLEPEFRDDKTHLFREFESALLQGDISNDLAEEAFFRYLKQLEALARLEIVTVYCEEKPHDRASNTLHVIGRTLSDPRKYFYRRYAHQMWTPWEPVEAEIEGDHVAAVIWRERLHLFWLTFLEKARPSSMQPSNADDEQGLAGVKLKNLIGKVSANRPLKDVEVQLNWSELFQGEWTTRESSGFGAPIRAENVGADFDPRSVSIHVSKKVEDEEERAVMINLIGGGFAGAFRLVSKNSPPGTDSPPTLLWYLPYSYDDQQASQFTGSQPLVANFIKQIKAEDGEPPEFTSEIADVLRLGGSYSLLSCVGYVEQEVKEALALLFGGSTLPAAAVQEIFSLLRQAEIKSLVSPAFYQDDRHTFFIEPTLVETTVEDWDDWIIPPLLGDAKLDDDQYWVEIPLDYEAPMAKPPVPTDPSDPRVVNPIDPTSRFPIRDPNNWVTNPATMIRFDGILIGRDGRSPSTVLPRGGNVIGGAGLNSALAKSLNLGRDLNGFNNGDLSDGSFNR
jgi:ABC toxin-like protein/neuraminidase-like protein